MPVNAYKHATLHRRSSSVQNRPFNLPVTYYQPIVPFTAKSNGFSLISRHQLGRLSQRQELVASDNHQTPTFSQRCSYDAVRCRNGARVSLLSLSRPPETPKQRPRLRSFASNQLISALLTLLDQFCIR
jgi:hypothetical protein